MYINVLTVITIIMYSLCVIVKQMFSGYVFHYNLNHILVSQSLQNTRIESLTIGSFNIENPRLDFLKL